MVSSTTSTWEAFHIGRARHVRLAEATKELVANCRKECGKAHLTQCQRCYLKLLSMMRERYVTHYDPKDWFAGRTEFIAEIDNMLNSAARGKIDVQTIDARIMAEKKIWQQFALPPRPRDRILSDKVGSERVKLKAKTDDDMDRVTKMITTHNSKVDACAEMFFSEYPEQETKSYVYMLKEGKPMAEVCEAIIEDEAKRERLVSQQKMERSRLEAELVRIQRAKAASAFEKKKKKDAAAQKPIAESVKPPPCAACGLHVNPESYIQCVECFIFADAGAIKEKTVYCSQTCHSNHILSHLTEHHRCSAETKCIHAFEVGRGADPALTEANGTNGSHGSNGANGANGTEKPVMCQECLREHHIPTLFCSVSCAKASFQAHRDAFHLPNRKPGERGRDEAQLDKINFTTYTAKNIRDHIIMVEEANRAAKEKYPSLKTLNVQQQPPE